MKCSSCGSELHGGYCDCMIVNGEFKGLIAGTNYGGVVKECKGCGTTISMEGDCRVCEDRKNFVGVFLSLDRLGLNLDEIAGHFRWSREELEERVRKL